MKRDHNGDGQPPGTPAPLEPRVDGGTGRNRKGQFTRGNPGGVGNPLGGRAAKIRALLLRKLTDRDAGRIAAKLIQMAAAGDLAAIKELFDRTIGKAAQADVLERIERLEKLLEDRANVE
jgi:hypothetical protein